MRLRCRHDRASPCPIGAAVALPGTVTEASILGRSGFPNGPFRPLILQANLEPYKLDRRAEYEYRAVVARAMRPWTGLIFATGLLEPTAQVEV